MIEYFFYKFKLASINQTFLTNYHDERDRKLVLQQLTAR